MSSGEEYKEQMRASQLTKKERDNALAMWAISVVAYSCCQPRIYNIIGWESTNCRLLLQFVFYKLCRNLET